MDKNFPSQTLLILGRNPTISIHEIRAKFPHARICAREEEFAIFENIEKIDLKEIGGVVKVGEVFARNDFNEVYEFLAKAFEEKKGKQIFGVSVYPLESKILKTLLLGSKKFLKERGISSRFANKGFTNLTNPQSEFEVVKAKGIEILVAKGKGNQIWFASLIQNQPFDSYKSRDYEKAFRDARVGMLPPKLAQMMVNLGSRFQGLGSRKPIIYDPFCGVGGVLIEASLMGCEVVGSDIDARMVEFSKKNLEAMKLDGEVFLHNAKQRIEKKYDVVVSEGYLGPPRKTIPSPLAVQKIFEELSELYTKFFGWVNCKRVVICFPIYLEKGIPKIFASKEILPKLKKLGWEMQNSEKLIYSRSNQTVGREVVVLEKTKKGLF